VYARMEMAYNKRDNKVMRERAREGAMPYDIDNVFRNYWVPTLATIQAKIDEEE